MARSLSAATRLKISRSLRGNKNAFSGGPKKKLSTRDKIANINAATKAKKANLSSDQIARRQSVAKRLRAQARREEALGGGNPGELKNNAEAIDQAIAQSDRLKQGGLQAMTKAKSADDIRAATGKIREARAALKEGMPRKARKESQAKVQPKAKQKLNAPQKPAEQREAKLQAARAELHRLRPSRESYAKFAEAQRSLKGASNKEFEAGMQRAMKAFRDENPKYSAFQDSLSTATLRAIAKRDYDEGYRSNKDGFLEAPANQADLKRFGDQVKNVTEMNSGQVSAYGRSRGAVVRDVPISGRGSRGGEGISAKNQSKVRQSQRREQPQSSQSDTGTDRSGTFTKKVPVKLTTEEQIRRQQSSWGRPSNIDFDSKATLRIEGVEAD